MVIGTARSLQLSINSAMTLTLARLGVLTNRDAPTMPRQHEIITHDPQTKTRQHHDVTVCNTNVSRSFMFEEHYVGVVFYF